MSLHPQPGSREPRNADDWLDTGEQWWAPYVLDVEAATPAEKAEALVDACGYWHKVADIQTTETLVLRGLVTVVRDCVDQMRLWEPHTRNHQAALRRLQEALDA